MQPSIHVQVHIEEADIEVKVRRMSDFTSLDFTTGRQKVNFYLERDGTPELEAVIVGIFKSRPDLAAKAQAGAYNLKED